MARRGKDAPNWKGGRYKNVNGYVLIYKPEHHRANKRGYVFEHILVAEEMVGHLIKKGEEIHHINGKRDENNKENIRIFPTKGTHVALENRLRKKKFQLITCKNCRKLFYPSKIGSVFCGLPCFRLWNRGANHWNYRNYQR